MEQTIEAVWEDGVLRPVEPLNLEERKRVFVTISEKLENGPDVAAYFTPEEWEAAKTDTITREEVWKALAAMPGSLADAVNEGREERF